MLYHITKHGEESWNTTSSGVLILIKTKPKKRRGNTIVQIYGNQHQMSIMAVISFELENIFWLLSRYSTL